MAYHPDFLLRAWEEYGREKGVREDEADPDDFIRWAYARALAHRQPRYRAMARRWGVTVAAEDMARVDGERAFVEVVAEAIGRRMRGR